MKVTTIAPIVVANRSLTETDISTRLLLPADIDNDNHSESVVVDESHEHHDHESISDEHNDDNGGHEHHDHHQRAPTDSHNEKMEHEAETEDRIYLLRMSALLATMYILYAFEYVSKHFSIIPHSHQHQANNINGKAISQQQRHRRNNSHSNHIVYPNLATDVSVKHVSYSPPNKRVLSGTTVYIAELLIALY